MAAPEKNRTLGKNVSFSEDQRVMLLKIIEATYKSVILPSEGAHDLLKSIRMAVDFSQAEHEIRERRAEKKAAEAKAALPAPPRKL